MIIIVSSFSYEFSTPGAHNGFGEHNCLHSEDIGVGCAAPNSTLAPSIVGANRAFDLQLVDGLTPYEGRIEIHYGSGEVGTVCDDAFDLVDANVVCRQLFGTNAFQYHCCAQYGEGTGAIVLDNVECAGNEAAIWDCPSNGWGNHNCAHSEDVGIVCQTPSSDPGSSQREINLPSFAVSVCYLPDWFCSDVNNIVATSGALEFYGSGTFAGNYLPLSSQNGIIQLSANVALQNCDDDHYFELSTSSPIGTTFASNPGRFEFVIDPCATLDVYYPTTAFSFECVYLSLDAEIFVEINSTALRGSLVNIDTGEECQFEAPIGLADIAPSGEDLYFGFGADNDNGYWAKWHSLSVRDFARQTSAPTITPAPSLSPAPTTSAPTSRSFRDVGCDFEFFDLCEWTTSTAYAWLRHSGMTPSGLSVNTGPIEASSGSYYMYVESSSPNHPNVGPFILESPHFAIPGTIQQIYASFSYSMNGAEMGNLTLQYYEDAGQQWMPTTFVMTGNQGIDWIRAAVPLPATASKIRFAAYTGSSYLSDIAIDSVILAETAVFTTKAPSVSPAPSAVRYFSPTFSADQVAPEVVLSQLEVALASNQDFEILSGSIRLPLAQPLVVQEGFNVEVGTADSQEQGATIDGMGHSQLFRVFGGLLLRRVELVNGLSTDGGAVAVVGTSASLELIECSASNNRAMQSGGVVAVQSGGTAIIRGGFFDFNSADIGGVLAVVGSHGLLAGGVTARSNIATTSGGVVFADKESVVSVEGGLFATNRAESGGVMSSEATSIVLRNSTAKRNEASDGAVLYIRNDYATLDMTGLVATENSANFGGVIHVAQKSEVVARVSGDSGVFHSNMATEGGCFFIDRAGAFNCYDCLHHRS